MKKLEKAALRNLKKTERLLLAGWTTGALHRISEGKDSYCLIGAIHVADGDGEDIATLALALAINKRAALKNFLSLDEVSLQQSAADKVWWIITNFNDSFERKKERPVPKAILQVLQKARRLVKRSVKAIEILKENPLPGLQTPFRRRASKKTIKEIRDIFK